MRLRGSSVRPPRGSCGGGGGAARTWRLAGGSLEPPAPNSRVATPSTRSSTPSPAPSTIRRRRRWTDEVGGALATVESYPLRPRQNAPAGSDEQLARARDDHAAPAGAVALAFDLAQDLAV